MSNKDVPILIKKASPWCIQEKKMLLENMKLYSDIIIAKFNFKITKLDKEDCWRKVAMNLTAKVSGT